MKFVAESVECSSRSDLETVFLGNEREQLALTITNYPGTTDHYFEWNDQSNSFTNAIQQCQLTGYELHIQLTPEAAKQIGEASFQIDLQGDEDVSQALASILGAKFEMKAGNSTKPGEKPKKDYSKIKFLDLEGKNITVLPDYVAEMTSLETVRLAHSTKLDLDTAFQVLGKLPVKSLSFTTDKPIPESIGLLTHLEDLSFTGFTKPNVFPESFGNLKKLKTILVMGDADIVLPESFAELSQLESLNMRVPSWQFTSQFHRLTNLTELDFSNCRLEQVPEGMAGMANVESVMFAGEEFHDYAQIMPILAKMPNLRRLAFAVDQIPKEVGLCQQIEEFVVYGGVGTLPDELFELTQLKKLIVNYRVLDEIPAGLGQLKNLETLALPECEFEGLPESLGELSSLTFLNLNENPVLNSLPSSLSKLSQLEALSLNYCDQLKRLPDGLEALQNLEQVSISDWDAIENVPSGWREKFSQ